MRERGISQEEAEEALRNVYAVTPADTPDRVHLWGRTGVGRRLRITTYRDNRAFIITVVAPVGEAG
jgi:hypothetical protein